MSIENQIEMLDKYYPTSMMIQKQRSKIHEMLDNVLRHIKYLYDTIHKKIKTKMEKAENIEDNKEESTENAPVEGLSEIDVLKNSISTLTTAVSEIGRTVTELKAQMEYPEPTERDDGESAEGESINLCDDNDCGCTEEYEMEDDEVEIVFKVTKSKLMKAIL